MTRPVVSIENLSKTYRLGTLGAKSFRAEARNLLGRLANSPKNLNLAKRSEGRRNGDVFWALNDLNVQISDGEAIGIIGGNGAGKSTLLKILSRVTAPTYGAVKLKGRVASLLEVGTGFHPDLTGRENIFLNGAILGMSRQHLRDKLDEIVAFSGVEEFIDTPVKRYSSGMYVRLAFSVAAHLDADILLMDEVLAVGDAVFQRKCLGKMEDAARSGRTVVFVSHNMVAVQSFCNRALMLEDGRVRADGPVGDVVSEYLDSGLSDMTASRAWSAQEAPGSELVRILGIRAYSESSSSPRHVISMDSPVRIEFDYHRRLSGSDFDIEVHLINHEDVVVLYTSPGRCPEQPGSYRSSVTIPGHFLNSGVYRAKLMLIVDAVHWSWIDGASVSFSVEDLDPREIGWMSRRPGVVHVPLPWQTESVASAPEIMAK